MSFSFLLTSDHHHKESTPGNPRRNPVTLCADPLASDDFVIFAGDATDKGRAYEINEFQTEFVDVVEGMGRRVNCVPGNHDYFTKWYEQIIPCKKGSPAMKYFENRGELKPYFFDHKNVRFISLGMYPTSSARLFLRNRMEGYFGPVVLFWHYNLEGAWSEGDEEHPFTKTDKDELWLLLSSFGTQIKGILCGHHHVSAKSFWKHWPVYQAAGDHHIARLIYHPDRKDLFVDYITF